jgi:serine/threonine protein phosphatase PrpC
VSQFRAAAATDVGVLRSSNQDSYLIADDMFAVADGMGGHNGGEVASRIAVETLRDGVDHPDIEQFVDAFQTANESIREQGREDPSLAGMGTTLVAIARVESDEGDMIALANVGDSRCYLVDGEGLTQYTRDHSLVQTLVDNGQITYAEAEEHPQRNILTRALGIDSRVMTDSWELAPVAGDRWLMCSDGLFNEVSDDDICGVLRDEANPGEAAAVLVGMANEGGGRDNITLVIVDVVDDAGCVAKRPGQSRVLSAMSGGHRAIVRGDTVERDPTKLIDSEDDGEDPDAVSDRRRGGVVSFRGVMFVAILVMVLLGVIGVVSFAGRSTYFVGFDDDEVTIFRGQPGGFLWFDPTVQAHTGITRDEVPPSFLDELESGQEESSEGDAEEYVERIRDEVAGDGAGGSAPVAPPATTIPPSTVGPDSSSETSP